MAARGGFFQHFLTASCLTMLAFAPAATAASSIYIGGTLAMSGPIELASKPYSQGVLDYLTWINDEKGGIDGRRVNFLWKDAHYSIPESVAFYKEVLAKGHPIAFMGVGTGDTVALLNSVTRDQLPFFSASCSDMIANAAKAPFNFFVNTTYAEQMDVALRFIATTHKNGRAKVALISIDNAMGRDPLPGAHDYAKTLPVDLLSDQILDAAKPDATSVASELAAAHADYVIIHGVGSTTEAVLNALKLVPHPPRVIALQYAFDEHQLLASGATANGVYGVTTFSLWDDDVPGMNFVKKLWARYHAGAPHPNYMYVTGLTQAMVLEEAIHRAGPNATSKTVAGELEKMTNFSTQGLTSPVTFSTTRHNGAHSARIRVFKDGKVTPVSDLLLLKD